MIPPRFIPLVLKQVIRQRTRSLLTVAGVAVAMFLFVTVQSLQRAVTRATAVAASDQVLVVYRENRFCPATSRLPEHYAPRIQRIPGVSSVIPIKIVVNNCAASLDVVTFRGIPADSIAAVATSWTVVDGSIDDWRKRTDAALVGEHLATRRGFKVGQSFSSSGLRVTVAGIVRSDQPQDQNVAYVHLPFLQRSVARDGAGIVTQLNVRVADPARLAEVAATIDAEFRSDAEPTQTRPEKAFVAQASSDIVEIVGFTRFLGWGCLAAVLGLVANAIALAVQDRIREQAVLQTLGVRRGLLVRLIVTEGTLVALMGGLVGAGAAVWLVWYGQFSLSNEGQSMPVMAEAEALWMGLVLSAGVGVLAGLFPAWQSARQPIAQCFRAW